jgi:hypothetical protein
LPAAAELRPPVKTTNNTSSDFWNSGKGRCTLLSSVHFFHLESHTLSQRPSPNGGMQDVTLEGCPDGRRILQPYLPVLWRTRGPARLPVDQRPCRRMGLGSRQAPGGDPAAGCPGRGGVYGRQLIGRMLLTLRFEGPTKFNSRSQRPAVYASRTTRGVEK